MLEDTKDSLPWWRHLRLADLHMGSARSMSLLAGGRAWCALNCCWTPSRTLLCLMFSSTLLLDTITYASVSDDEENIRHSSVRDGVQQQFSAHYARPRAGSDMLR